MKKINFVGSLLIGLISGILVGAFLLLIVDSNIHPLPYFGLLGIFGVLMSFALMVTFK